MAMYKSILNLSLMALVLGHSFLSFAAGAKTDVLPGSVLENGVETFTIDCSGNPQQTTIDINECYGTKLAQVEAIQRKYVAMIRKKIAAGLNQPPGHARKILDAFDAENNAWVQLQDAAATATYTDWEDGTIRGIKSADRKLSIIELRVHNQWENWLRYEDSTPAVLPEPRFNNVP